ncbi:hypothetical protein PIROE2DRAFT_59649 [Piromyces sp. E2]|nr:hypothetical protein PIROE2DRAFT_59649 [Piromyces sp. E2]|eukprot:OUM66000.1 hypothetical protein PIROE2DRAFT_59649 [Piromyces sp. E2]
MSDFYDYFEVDSYNVTSQEDHFIGGPSIVIIGMISFTVIIMIILAIHLFSKKLENMECEAVHQEIDPIEEIEPLPLYQEREILTEAEVNLSNYIQSSNTINTIPRDTMNIINRLNEASSSSSHEQYTRILGNNQTNHDPTEHQEGEPRPSTSTIPVPLPEKENMPRIPPPCYDVALTQPRISNKGMIVLPQDPSFSILPFISRSSATIQHQSIRRNRERLRNFFSLHRHHSRSSLSSNSPNDYRLQDPPTLSTSSHSHSTSSTTDSTPSETESLNHHRRRESSLNESRSRSFFGRRHRHPHYFRRQRRRRLRVRHSTDNASISSISVYYPTSVIDIPEDHYNIENQATDPATRRNYRVPSYTSSVGRNTPTNVTTINDDHDPDLSISAQHLLSNISECGTTTAPLQSLPYQNSSLEVLNGHESWLDISPSIPSTSTTPEKGEIIHIDSSVRAENSLDNIASTSTNQASPSNYININMQSNNHNHNHNEITIHSNFDPVHSNINDTSYHNTNERDTVINVITY